MRRTSKMCLTGFAVAWTAVAAAASTVVTSTAHAAETGKVVRVTLYRGQAMVTRKVPVDAGAGAREIVVANLPEHVVKGSLFAESSEGIEVRAVRYRTRALGEEPREAVRKLEVAIEQLNTRARGSTSVT